MRSLGAAGPGRSKVIEMMRSWSSTTSRRCHEAQGGLCPGRARLHRLGRRWGAPGLLAALLLATAAAGARAQADQRIKPGSWRVNDEPDGFEHYRTRNYEVQSQIPRERADLVVNHLEAMMVEYWRRFKTRKPLKDFVLKIFKDRKAYMDYGGSAGSLAYYTSAHDELVCFDTGVLDMKEASEDTETLDKYKKRLKELGLPEELLEAPDVQAALMTLMKPGLLGVLSHEGWHQYFHFWIVSMIDFPSWLDEGMGDYFYTAQVSEDRKTVTTGILNPMRFPVIWNAIRENKHVPIKDLIRFRQRDYYANPSLCYAEGWSLVYFCYHSGNPEYAKIPDKIIRVFKDKHNMDKATDAAFRKIDLDRFEEEWKAFYMKMPFKETMVKMAMDLTGSDLKSLPGTTPSAPKSPETPAIPSDPTDDAEASGGQ